MQAVRLLLGKQPNLHLSPQACVNICILFLAMLSSLDLLNYSARESAWSHSRHELTRQEMLCPPGCLRAGSPEHRLVFDGQPSIDTAEQMHGLWCILLGSCLLERFCRDLQLVFVRLCSCRLRCQKHDRRVALLFFAFNYTAPLFMFNIALSTLLKFYMAPAAGWTGVFSLSCSCSCWPPCPLSLLASNVSNSRPCLLVRIQTTRVGRVLAGNCCLGATIPPILQESRFIRWQ